MELAVIATRSKDIINDKDNSPPEIRYGGPAYWIEQTCKELRVPYRLITNTDPAVVEITVSEHEETGRIVDAPPIYLDDDLQADITVVSTIYDEFDLQQIRSIPGPVALDVQGYIRALTDGHTLQLAPEIVEKITIAKMTEDESMKVSPALLESLKQKILIISHGRDGFDLYTNGTSEHFPAVELSPSDTIGAGDTLLTVFCISYAHSKNASEAAAQANEQVKRFLLKKA